MLRKSTSRLWGITVIAVFICCLGISQPVLASSIVGWGRNDYGQTVPPAGEDFVSVGAGAFHSLALKRDGSIVAWGDNTYGQTNIPAGNDFVAISSGISHGLALKSDGSLVSWGENNKGQLNNPAGNDFTDIASGVFFNLAIRADGSLVGWGDNDHGQCNVPTGNDFKAIAAGYWHAVALRNDGSLITWGYMTAGVPVTSPTGNDFIAVAAGHHHGLALRSDRSLAGWGYNSSGQCNVPAGNDFVAVAGGYNWSLALKNDGSLIAWGGNDYGQTTVPAGNDFAAIGNISLQHGLALKMPLNPRRIYVDEDAPGANNGSFWADAFNHLQDALSIAIPGDEIRVAQGVYRPDETTANPDGTGDRQASFQLVSNVILRGGYAGFGEPDPNVQDPNAYPTVLSGDLNGDDVEVVDPCDLLDEPSRAENSHHVVVSQRASANTVLDGFTIRDGNTYAGGGMYNYRGCPKVTNCTFNDNSAHFGGGMYNSWHGDPILTGCTFSGNSAYFGGGVENTNLSNPILTDCTFRGNAANTGGGMDNYHSDPILTNCTFSGNSANDGGGMYCEDSESNIEGCTFFENRGPEGAVSMWNSQAHIEDCSFLENSDTGIYIQDGSVATITGCCFERNGGGEYGGAVSMGNSDLLAEDCVFIENYSGMNGGAMTVGDLLGSGSIVNCRFAENTSEYGGAIFVWQSDGWEIVGCEFYNNKATYQGGAIQNSYSDSDIVNCTFRQNYADLKGGAIFNYSSGGSISNSIAWENIAPWGYHIYHFESTAILTISHCDIECGWDGPGVLNENAPSVVDGGGNMAEDPQFVALDDLHLLADSPCINAGTNTPVSPLPAYDLDGTPRILEGTVDMGAYEYTQPLKAWDPYPEDGATNIDVWPGESTLTLQWVPGAMASSHQVYFGSDRERVTNAQPDWPEYRGTRTWQWWYELGPLEMNMTYYWRIDEINDLDPENPWVGDVWEFTAADYLIVDDMDFYHDYHDMDWTWIDGDTAFCYFGHEGTGSSVSLDTTTVWDFRQSMWYYYDNDGTVSCTCCGPPIPPRTRPAPFYSMAKAEIDDLPIPWVNSDWTTAGVETLVLWFYGDAWNSVEPMWVQLTDSAGHLGIVEYGDHPGEDPNAIAEDTWHQWLLSLDDFANQGVNTADVNSIAIGIGDINDVSPGGSGRVIFDAIRLYRPMCDLYSRSPVFAEVDYWPISADSGVPSGDCIVDYGELQIMARDWLLSDLVEPVEPNSAGLLAWYQFEGNADDSSGNSNHGTVENGAAYVAGHGGGQAIDLDGVDDYVSTGKTASDLGIGGNSSRTVAAWVYTRAFNMGAIFDVGNRSMRQEFSLRTKGDVQNVWRVQYWDDDYDFVYPSLNEWVHFAHVHDGDRTKVYANGELVVDWEKTLFTTNINPFQIGCYGWQEAYFDGVIDDLRVYDYALSHGEVLFVAELDAVEIPLDSPANISDAEPPSLKIVNFRDYAKLMTSWLNEEMFP